MKENTSYEQSGVVARAGLIWALALGSVAPILAGCDSSQGIPPELIGTWSRYEESNGLEYRYTFMQDGTFLSSTRDDAGADAVLASGTFSTTDTTLLVEATRQDLDIPRWFRSEQTYHVNDSYYVYMAMLPDGEHDGLIGTWTGWYRGTSYEGDEVVDTTDWTMTMTIRSDGVATWTFMDGDETHMLEGQYAEVVPGLLYELESSLRFWSFDGRALGIWVYEPVTE